MLPCAGHNASCYGEETVGFERLKAKCSCKVKCITDFQVKIMCYHRCCKTVVMFLCWQIFHENKIGCSQVRVRWIMVKAKFCWFDVLQPWNREKVNTGKYGS